MESSDGSPQEGANGAGGSILEKEATLAVKVALNIRPLIGLERVQGCKDCITVVPGEPQVQIGSHSFTFDHVYGSSGTPLTAIFDECVSPLVDGLFQGFNATVLAYGQTGSGKTYTMGTGYCVGGSTEGVIPKVMETIFNKMERLKATADFQIRVSFIEILKEEVHDLLDLSPPSTARGDPSNAGSFLDSKYSGKPTVTGKPPIQIRETTGGGITLAGVTETDVTTLGEMALCLEQGSLCRATGSTMMNTLSSRSHAIFTILVEQRRKWDILPNGASPLSDDVTEDYLCAKFHLVDLAGSERAKRTGADGVRFKEGVHINKGLLALGNVISALGDDKKRKEGGHIPYRDSKLTRLLQDSLGGNSRTVMIACVSPADSNAEETLNTLKYANRARNIQNKPSVNRDPMAAEMSRMRQQLELMQAELLCARAGSAPEEVQLLKQKIAWLETSNMDLRHELQEARNSIQELGHQALDARVEKDKLCLKLEKLRGGMTFADLDEEDDTQVDGLLKEHLGRIQELETELQKLQGSRALSRPQSALASLTLGEVDVISSLSAYADVVDGDLPNVGADLPVGSVSGVVSEAEDHAKELEHNMLQENFDKQLQELNKCLEQKEAEMKTFVRPDAVILKQHFERKLVELEEEKKVLQTEKDMLLNEIEMLTTTSDEQTHKMQETYGHKLKELESQITELKRKQENQSQHLRAKQRADEAAKRLQEDILRIKTQKVQLQQKIKQESEQFRMWKASREKELLQLRKEGRRNEYEMHKLQALNQRQKLVLQRKTEEAAIATRRLKELLEARKSPRDTSTHVAGSGQSNEKTLQHWLDQELEMAVRVHEVRSAYDKQMEQRVVLAKELMLLKEEEEVLRSAVNQTPSMSPGARTARVRLLETMLNSSSSALVAMASQLSEAEERERISGGRARWQHMRSMGDAKSLLQFAFDSSALSRCRLRDIEEENKEIKEKLAELQQLLRQSDACRKELEMQQQSRDQPVRTTQTTITMAGFDAGMKKDNSTKISVGDLHQRVQDLKQPLYSDQSSDQTTSGTDTLGGRKAGRVRMVAPLDETSDDSDGEDMDTESDEEWHEDTERQAVRRNRALGGFRLSKPQSRSMSLEQKPTTGSLCTVRKDLVQGLLVSQPSSGENILEDNEDKGKERLYLCSCSCSQSSGCKTKKCECKAAGGLCGSQCGCKSVKCNNREAVALEEGQPLSVAPPLQVEMAETMATRRLDKIHRRLEDSCEAVEFNPGVESALHIVTEEEHVTKRAERLLAVHGAVLLDNAWKEELQDADVQDEVADGKIGESADDEFGENRSQRRALRDIGNKVPARRRPTAKQRKKQTTVIQLVPVGPLQNTGSSISLNATALGAATGPHVASTNNATSNLPLATVSDIVSPLWRQQSLQRRNRSGQSSPLRLRDNKIGLSIGGTSDDMTGGTKNVKATGSGGPGSPKGPSRASDEKENIQRNSFV